MKNFAGVITISGIDKAIKRVLHLLMYDFLINFKFSRIKFKALILNTWFKNELFD